MTNARREPVMRYEPCPMCTANRPRLCDLHYQQRAEEFMETVKQAVIDHRTPSGVKATYEELLDINRALADRLAVLEQQRIKYGPICLNCGKAEPCMTDEEAAQHGASIPCTFDPAPKVLFDRCKELEKRLAEVERERDDMQLAVTIAKKTNEIQGQQLTDAQATISRLEDRIDLQCDEFQRISALTENDEVKGLCARAVKDIRQHVPVIQQRDTAEQQVARLRDIVRDLIDRVDVDNLTTQTVVRQAEEVLRGTDGQH